MRSGRHRRVKKRRAADAEPAEAAIAGSVGEVAEQLRASEEIGYTEILVRHLTNDQPKVLGSLERLATVRPALAQA
jgi:alkanesulfonate monooxygenase SsuD/methylene tetrahydromethanopterin reductase-like flavin-dependent oxidoreductase (luciferase family)